MPSSVLIEVILSRLDQLRASSPEDVPTGVEELLGTLAAAIGATVPGTTAAAAMGGAAAPGGGGGGGGGSTAGGGFGTGACHPGGLDTATSVAVATALTRTLTWMHHARDQGRTAQLAMCCLNHWLLQYGPGQPHARLTALHAEAFTYVWRTWQDHRLPKLKVCE
jgi:hypothetical protein